MNSSVITLISEFWELIVLVAGSLGGLFSYIRNRNKSTNQMYETLEDLKLQILENIEKEVDVANDLAEKEKLLNEMRINCPECYEKYVNKNKVKGNE